MTATQNPIDPPDATDNDLKKAINSVKDSAAGTGRRVGGRAALHWHFLLFWKLS